VSRNFDALMSGPFAVLGRDLVHFFSDPANIRLIPVATLEEMPVDETVEMCRELEKDLNMRPSVLLCNLASPMLSAPEEAYRDLAAKTSAGGPGAAGMSIVLDRHAGERALFMKLVQSVSVPLHVIPRVARWASDLDLLRSLGRTLGDLVPA
jgi:hypothetical protein